MTGVRAIAPWTLTVAGLFIAAAVGASAGELNWPDTRVAKIARGYIESFNSNDLDTLRAFAATHRTEKALAQRSAEARAERRLEMYAQIGPLKPVLITKTKATSLTVTCRAEKSGMWLRMKVKLEDDPPRKLDYVEMRPTSAPDLTEETAANDAPGWSTLAELLERIRGETGVPGLAAAVVEGGRVIDIAAVGARAVGSIDRVTINDRWHAGSITKSMTATMIGALVEEGTLSWETSIGDVFTDVDMKDAYRNVTVAELLRHIGGVQPYATVDEEEEQRLGGLPGTPTEQRAAFVGQVLQQTPAASRGDFVYSNAGYAVVGHIAERVTGASWESLLERHVFGPLGMEQAGFGWPATPGRPDQPRGHYRGNDELRVQEFGEYEFGAYLGPAGDVHLSIGDLASLAILHLEGLRGRDGAIRAETVQALHRPPEEPATAYACGWMLEQTDQGPMHGHAGSAGTLFAQIELYPDSNRGIVIAMNIGLEGAGISQRITELIKERW